MLNRLTDVFSSFQKHEVRYLVIGGIAAVLYGIPRVTFDLDILIEATLENVQKLIDALLDANLGTADLTTAHEILAHEITVFQDRIRIDVQTSTPGLKFTEAWKNREIFHYRGQDINVVSKYDLIASKKASGRQIDLEDVRLLVQDDQSKP